MTTLPTCSPGRILGTLLGRILTVIRAVAVTLLLALAIVALTAVAPAAAVRSGPDVAVRAGVDIPTASAGGTWFAPDGDARPTATGMPGPGASWTGITRADGSDAVRSDAPPTGYMPPVPGVDPPVGVAHPFDPPEEEWGAGHRGVDLIAPRGSRVVSPGPGIVTFAGQVARRGVVVVTHPDGLRTSLEPVAAEVRVGTAVAAGAVIGVVEGGPAGGVVEGGPAGSGGGTTPNHCAPRSCVHWGVRRGERYIDPLSLLDRPPIVLLPDE